jgi:hypothetical protein
MTKTERNRMVAWRLKLLRLASDLPRSVAHTCRYFGLSRKTFYKWRARYKSHGEDIRLGHDSSKSYFLNARYTSVSFRAGIFTDKMSHGTLPFMIGKRFGFLISIVGRLPKPQ